jgi:adenine-specific DNA-methyltransferase
VSRLSELLRQVERVEPTLAADLGQEVRRLAGRRAFGLNFERHLPELVELPGRPVRTGDRVRLRGGNGAVTERLWRVVATRPTATGRVASLIRRTAPEAEPETAEHPVDRLVVVATFHDPIHPGLRSLERIERGGAAPFHVVINAENAHALRLLRYTHPAAVDAIYIDPPYNTGNDGWIYNDRYVGADDLYRHSKWLAFMERRLMLARELLKPTGVIVVAIGDDEHHRLRMLLDQIFGAENFIANITWQGGGSSLARHMAGGADYMLVYARRAELVPRFRDPKPYARTMLAVVQDALAEGRGAATAQTELRAWIRAHRSHLAAGLAGFNSVEEDGRVYDTADITNRLPRPNLRYPVTDPASGRVFEPPANGWTVSREVMAEWAATGLLSFRGTVPRKKKYLDEYLAEMPLPTFTRSRSTASGHLATVLGDRRFPFPKDHEVLMRWLRMIAPKDAVVLDFFGGSGTTTEAVIRLNAEDGGTRRSVLVTNNEVAASDAARLRRAGVAHGDPAWEAKGVFEHVTRPRIRTVVTGVRPDGSVYSEGLAANVELFALTYEAPRAVLHHRSFAAIAPLLWLRAGARGSRIDEPTGDYAVADAYAVLFDLDHTADFVKAVAAHGDLATAFVLTDDERGYQSVCAELPPGVEPVRLYASYLASAETGSGDD